MADDLKKWEIGGVLALLVIVLSIPFYFYKEEIKNRNKGPDSKLSRSTFVGREACLDCHKPEYDKWKGSHHDLAMDIADDTTVLGDFDNSIFEHGGITTRFFKKNTKFYVNTEGPDGRMADFEITHTFGAYPLQQYLVPFPGGRLQCLTIAWDVEKKKWYHLYPDQEIPVDDWLHWTNQAQNWNSMCAECHSTNLTKGYDIKTDTYNTSWSEIDVSCEACHGPCSTHVKWANMPEMARPPIENYGLVNRTGNLASRELVELCARCHARRSFLGDYTHPQVDVLDHMIPQLLSEGMYFPDGQILEEVYVYGSFLQSKMYSRDVRCSDCHDIHSLKRVSEGNELCLQCHRRDVYDRKEHHFHKKKGEKGDPIKLADGTIIDVGEGAKCETCHMPGRYYMGIDYRLDHSIRIPRPDLSVTYNTPNACNECHKDKTSSWSEEYITKWYGKKKKPHYGEVFSKARNNRLTDPGLLIKTADDMLLPVIVRATAASLLSHYPIKDSVMALERALMDDSSLMRQTAIRTLNRLSLSVEDRVRFAVPLLYDPVKGVRMEAALCLSPIPQSRLKENERKLFDRALKEYIVAMEYTGEFPQSQFNLGLVYSNLGNLKTAEKHYKNSMRIDNLFYPAKVNLAMLYNQRGMNEQAEVLLKEAYDIRPDMHELAYSLGLLLVESNKITEAADYLERAAKGMPSHARVHYNLGLLFENQGRFKEAEQSLTAALKLEPENMDFLYALAIHYIRINKPLRAKIVAEKMAELNPEFTAGTGILDRIQQAIN